MLKFISERRYMYDVQKNWPKADPPNPTFICAQNIFVELICRTIICRNLSSQAFVPIKYFYEKWICLISRNHHDQRNSCQHQSGLTVQTVQRCLWYGDCYLPWDHLKEWWNQCQILTLGQYSSYGILKNFDWRP